MTTAIVFAIAAWIDWTIAGQFAGGMITFLCLMAAFGRITYGSWPWEYRKTWHWTQRYTRWRAGDYT